MTLTIKEGEVREGYVLITLKELRQMDAKNAQLHQALKVAVARIENPNNLTKTTRQQIDEALSNEPIALHHNMNTAADDLARVLRSLGHKRQFDQLCWCNTIAGTYCVGQSECKAAQKALEDLETLKRPKP